MTHQPYIVIDFETFYSKDYTLQKLTPVEYILDPRFDCFGAAVAEGDEGSVQWMPHDKLLVFLKEKRALQRAGTKLKVVSHNALFDMCILSWRYGVLPDLMIDTVAMSRALLRAFTPQGRVSLAAVAKHLGLEEKGGTLQKTMGMTYGQIKEHGLLLEFAAYAVNDAHLCREIFKALRGDFPLQEFLVADELIRCCVVPRFQVNLDRLGAHFRAVLQAKAELLTQLSRSGREVTADLLMSNDKFADLLRAFGVEPPLKTSLVTGKAAYAFAKTDDAMAELAEHPDPMVQALVAARLGHKTTLEETRTRKLISIANLTWPGNLGSKWMPIPLRYSGAHTHRFSGDWKINCMHPDVEVLTPSGWQRIEDWSPTIPIMQWWPDGRLTWDTRANKVSRQDDELVWFNSYFVKGGFTCDHRMVSLRKGKVAEHSAGWIADHSGLDDVPTAGTFDNPNPSARTPDEARLLVALAADGSVKPRSGRRVYHPNGTVTRPGNGFGGWQFGFHKARKVERLRHLLASCGVRFSENGSGKRRSFQIGLRSCPDWLVKGFGLWSLRLSPAAMDALLDELVFWDGFKNSRSGSTTLVTTDREQARWIQTVAHIRGRACTVRAYDKASNFGPCKVWYVYFRKSSMTSIKKHQVSRLPYEGTVYCPQVDSSYVLARYQNGVFVTGQCQNWPARPVSELARAHEAPVGYTVVKADSSQVECRIVCWLAGATEMLEAFRKGEDIYSMFGTRYVYHREISRATPLERFLCKQAVLGLGYQMGPARFQTQVRRDSRAHLAQEIILSDNEAASIVQAYRTQGAPQVRQMWDHFRNLIPLLASQDSQIRFGPVLFEEKAILLPSGLRLFYHDLHREESEKGPEWWFTYAGKKKKLFPGKLTENIVQALARIVNTDAMLRMRKRFPDYPLAHQKHDELIYVVPSNMAETFAAALVEEMIVRPSWAPDLPLAAESGMGWNYGDCK